MEDGAAVILINEERHEIGPFLGGMGDAFPADSKGRPYAQQAERASSKGILYYFGGLGAFVIGAILPIASDSGSGPGTTLSDRNGLLLGSSGVLALGGLISMFVGMDHLMEAQTSTIDAINAHNDQIWSQHTSSASKQEPAPSTVE